MSPEVFLVYFPDYPSKMKMRYQELVQILAPQWLASRFDSLSL
jgi:hypothetical protein